MKIKRVCQICGKEFEIYESSLHSSNSSGKFCSRKCYNEYQKTLTGSKNNHCSRIQVKCACCGKTTFTTPYRAALYKNKFCSLQCKHDFHHNYTNGEKNGNWKGGASRYRGDDFERIKREKFKDCFCALCGTKNNVHIHHIIPFRLTQDNSEENLVPLCAKHHKLIESLFVKNLESLGNYETTKFILRNIFDTFYNSHITKEKKDGKIKN